jgi:hypothetical protein
LNYQCKIYDIIKLFGTPGRNYTDNILQQIINIKLAENQLDECGLTLGDLSIVKSSFKEILLSSLHQRPKYPSSEDTKKLENKEDKKIPAKKMRVSKTKK